MKMISLMTPFVPWLWLMPCLTTKISVIRYMNGVAAILVQWVDMGAVLPDGYIVNSLNHTILLEMVLQCE